MTAAIVLAVDAEGIKLLLVNAFTEVCTNLSSLDVTAEVGHGKWRVALRLSVTRLAALLGLVLRFVS